MPSIAIEEMLAIAVRQRGKKSSSTGSPTLRLLLSQVETRCECWASEKFRYTRAAERLALFPRWLTVQASRCK